MTHFVLVRHGQTQWNVAGRIQGHTDIPLNEVGREQVSKQRIPDTYYDARWVCSPLVRAVETARLMGCADPRVEPVLKEMNWGDWEGRTLKELKEKYGAGLKANEGRGLDFRPDSGESPRDVQKRVTQWMRSISVDPVPVVAVTHKGVIRAILSAAIGWDMTGPAPLTLDWTCAHVFDMNEDGRLSLQMANVTLREDDQGDM